ncbi:MAG: D-alanyl-D-alanine carboxypeptidase family protein [Clostridia bacterium]
MKRIISTIIALLLIFSVSAVYGAQPQCDAKAVLLMDYDSGTVLYESNSAERLAPASVTKIMTMLLIMEAIERGEIGYDTIVTASERAKSMGGSTIFLDTNEQMSVNDLLKGIAVASGNDACVAMAEHLCGSVEAFVEKMNARAAELGMENTHFVNCNGLDADGHYSSAMDIAIMSRELMKHKDIFKYTTIWMDSLRDGAFQLANTNKLIRFYDGATGLKTGSTDKALCCISATAKRDNMHLIAVVLGSPNSKARFAAARELLNYGFANFSTVKLGEKDKIVCTAPVSKGNKTEIGLVSAEDASALLPKDKVNSIETQTEISGNLSAPIKKGDVLGKVTATLDGAVIAQCSLVAAEDVDRKSVFSYFTALMELFMVI